MDNITKWSKQELNTYFDSKYKEWNRLYNKIQKIKSNPTPKDTFNILKEPNWIAGLESQYKVIGDQLVWVETLIKSK